MTTEICMLARSWTQDVDPTNWLMSEKFHGIRMIRPRGNLDLFSREGNVFRPPAWWRDMLPRGVFLDGEAFIGYGKFELTQSILEKTQASDEDWRQLTFRCIEPCWAPGTKMQVNAVFKPILQVVCKGRDHLREFYGGIVESGGEGVILRHPRQPYHVGRSPYLLRVKPELKGSALVEGYNFNDGKLTSIRCLCVRSNASIPHGDPMGQFNISNGLTEESRAHPPLVGTTVNYTYQCKSANGTPMFARLTKGKF